MVISYPENIKNNVDDITEKNINFMNPFITFTNEKTLSGRLCEFMKEQFNISKNETKKAASKA